MSSEAGEMHLDMIVRSVISSCSVSINTSRLFGTALREEFCVACYSKATCLTDYRVVVHITTWLKHHISRCPVDQEQSVRGRWSRSPRMIQAVHAHTDVSHKEEPLERRFSNIS